MEGAQALMVRNQGADCIAIENCHLRGQIKSYASVAALTNGQGMGNFILKLLESTS